MALAAVIESGPVGILEADLEKRVIPAKQAEFQGVQATVRGLARGPPL